MDIEQLQESTNEAFRNYCAGLDGELKNVWRALPRDLASPEVAEVVGALLARQATLTVKFAENSAMWNGDTAPLFIRSVIECHIVLAWVLGDPVLRCEKFIFYGLGQAKLILERYKQKLRSGAKDEIVQKLSEFWEQWINSQRWSFLTEVNVGNWAGIDVRKMSEEAGVKEAVYDLGYMPYSGAVHNMWHHIERFNMCQCENPLHRYHRVPIISRDRQSLDYFLNVANRMQDSFDIVRKKYGIKPDAPSPRDALLDELDRLGTAMDSDSESPQANQTHPSTEA